MTQGISLIVGLGNPGSNYAETRHNAGFRFIDGLLRRLGASLKNESRFDGEAGKVVIAGRDVWLLMPQTFMNASGQSLARLANFYKIAPEEILVVHDELDLPPGSVRLKQGGGHGGHNGLRDIISRLGSREFMRLRIGIGHPGSAPQVESYVLKKAPKAEQQQIDAAIDAALAQVDEIVHGNYEQVMNDLHTHRA
ncbi:MAG: peptidyl-tRNA hydrolase [Acidithiobacillales bacterium SG8_45]|jgi:PTH1 family peptidyl-tRNA hydrolase|nr:MAG: peptidyl-tRNA hydrolase [Acidithiobacillales bacterium SG8_45]